MLCHFIAVFIVIVIFGIVVVMIITVNAHWSSHFSLQSAGKAVNERKAELRVQFRETSTALFANVSRNELVMRVQPDEAIYMKVMTKQPGLEMNIVQRELDLTYVFARERKLNIVWICC